MNLKNKTIVITGASEWIGEQIAYRLAKEKVHLVLMARNIERVKEVWREVMKLWAKSVAAHQIDLSDTSKISKLVNEMGEIDILINNAGIWQKMMQLDEVPAEKIDPIIATNLSSVIHLTHSMLPILRRQEEWIILNIVSQSGVVAQAGQSVYTATKYGVRGFTDTLKADLKGSNVRVAGSIKQVQIRKCLHLRERLCR